MSRASVRTWGRRPRGRGVWAVDVANHVPRSLPETGLGRGWEPAMIVAITVVLLLFGLLTLHSASSVMAERDDLPHYHYVVRQGSGVLLGLVVMLVCSRVPTEWLARLAPHMMIGSLLLLIVVVLPFTGAIAPEINGARRWIRLPGVTLQPSDIAKIAVLVWTAALAVRKRHLLRHLGRGLAPFLVGWGAVLLLILLEPDTSTACLIAALGGAIVFAAGGRIGHFVLLGALTVPFVTPMLRAGYRAARWDSLFLNPGGPVDDSVVQSYQSLVALGSGGVKGAGFGAGRQKFGFVPEAHNDFIFAMIGEEWGFVGSLALILGYLALIAIAFRVARRAKDLFGELLAVGVASLIGLHAFLHIGVGLGVFPATGLSLPFVSFGRTNMIAMLAAVGILLAVAREMPEGRSERLAAEGG